jgi:hypothetical protein
MNDTHDGLSASTNEATIAQVKPDLLILTEEQRIRFESKVDKSGGPDACWPWIASRMHTGYGWFRLNGKMMKAHRVAYRLWKGAIPDGLHVLHKCDNPCCCNSAAHHFLGTPRDNTIDKMAKGRVGRAIGERNGAATKPESIPRGEKNPRSKLTDENVRQMRLDRAAGKSTLKQLGMKYGVSISVVHATVTGKRWKHISPAPASPAASVVETIEL